MLKLSNKWLEYVNSIEDSLGSYYKDIDNIELINSKKVLDAFHKYSLCESDLIGTNGYGLNDISKDKVEKIFSYIFSSEDALVRREFVSASHALSISLSALLRPNDNLLIITGKPYDTLDQVIGIRDNSSSLKSYGVNYTIIDYKDNCFDYDNIRSNVINAKVVYIQRSKGYSLRDSISIDELDNIIKFVKSINSNVIVFVDNCYTEFTESISPCEVGADIIVGSLIKNLGAGICTHGAYVCGKKDLVHLVSERLYLPGEGKDIGPSFDFNRMVLMGLYYSPTVISSSIKGGMLFSKAFEDLGYKVSPRYNEKRSCIVTTIYLNNRDDLIDFTNLIQESGAVNSMYKPVPSDMPGYSDKIIMASPSFTQGSSIELSCDAPIREPYIVFFQGGISYYYIKLALINVLSNLKALN